MPYFVFRFGEGSGDSRGQQVTDGLFPGTLFVVIVLYVFMHAAGFCSYRHSGCAAFTSSNPPSNGIDKLP